MKHTHYYQVSSCSNYELGYQLGKLFKSPSLYTYHATLRKTSYDTETLKKASSYLRVTQTHFPQYIEELQGYAKGIDVDFNSFWISFLSEELDSTPEKCTSLFTNNGTLIGHNEDFSDHFQKRICVLEKTLKNLTILELYYYDSLGGTAVSINSHGYVQTINTLNHGQAHTGVPRNIIARWMSETKDPLNDALKLKNISRSLGYSHTFISRHGSVFNIESTSDKMRCQKCEVPYVHTNHFLSDLCVYEDKNQKEGNSIERFRFAEQNSSTYMNVSQMKDLLERVSGLESNKKRVGLQTIGRAVIDLKEKKSFFWLKRESKKRWVEYPLHFL